MENPLKTRFDFLKPNTNYTVEVCAVTRQKECGKVTISLKYQITNHQIALAEPYYDQLFNPSILGGVKILQNARNSSSSGPHA